MSEEKLCLRRTDEQKDDVEVLDLIKKRLSADTASTVYKKG